MIIKWRYVLRLVLPTILLFILLGVLIANAVVWLLENNHTEQQLTELTKLSETYEQQLQTLTSFSLAVGGLKTLGLSDSCIKEQVKNEHSDNDPSALAKLAIIQHLFSADGVYIISGEGRIVAHQTAEKSSVGVNVAFRPYFQQAMKGIANVYPGVGSSSGERGLYFAVPIYETDIPNSTIIGVLMMKKDINQVITLLNTFNGHALLLSPQGVVFASSDPDLLYHVMPPVSDASIEAIRKLKQFGKLFNNNNEIKPLPFQWQEKNKYTHWNEQTYHAVSANIDWSDPLGDWKLLLLKSDLFVLSRNYTLLVYGGIPALFSLLGLLFSWQLVQFRHYRQTQSRLTMMGIALENSPMGVMMTDAHKTIQWINPALEKMTGYPIEKLIGQQPTLLRSGQTPDTIYKDLSASLLAKQSWYGEFVNRRADGSHFWIESTISPVYDKQQLMGYVSMSDDVSEKRNTLKKLESQLALTEASSRFLAAIKSGQNPQLLAEQALVEAMSFLNIPFAAIYATLPSDGLVVLGCLGNQTKELLLTPEKRSLIDSLMLHALPLTLSTLPVSNAKTISSIMMLPIGNGKTTCGLLEIGLLAPLTQEKLTYLDSIIREFASALRLSLDLLMRQKIETRAIEAEARTRLLIEAVDDGILGLNAQGIITFANPAAAKLLECESIQALSDKTIIQMLFHNDSQAMMDTGIMTSLNYGEKQHSEHNLITQKGKSFTAEITSIPMKTNKEWDGIVVVFRDISERQRAQQQLEAQMNELTRFTEVAVGRELKMSELKEKINALLIASGREKEYVTTQ